MQAFNEASTPRKTLPRMYASSIQRAALLTSYSVKKYGLTMMVTADDQVKAYIKKIMSQLKEWMYGGKISKLVVVITSKETGEHVERWQFDVSCVSNRSSLQLIVAQVQIFGKGSKTKSSKKTNDKENSTPEYV